MSTEIAQLMTFIGSNRAPIAPMSINVSQLGFANFYWSTGGEDVAMRQLFKAKIAHKEPGIYVDIGCNRPSFISNTYMFYCLGWSGLGIDADDFASEWSLARPKDIFEQVAVGEEAGEAFFFRHTTNHGMHYVSRDECPRSPHYEPARRIRVRRLEDLFSQHLKSKQIDFMSLDIEGEELEALKSNDWSRWRPHAVIMECEFNFTEPYAAAPVAYLRNLGYELVGKLGANVILKDGTQ